MGTAVLLAVACLVILGVAFGAGLAVASKRFHVEVDPRVEEVYEALPHIDCGACGYAGCVAYATAVVTQAVAVDLCVPGGADTARAVGRVMGVEVSAEREKCRAVVHCQGGLGEARRAFEYSGVLDCRAALLAQGGPKECSFGCLGFSTCATVCPYDAIEMSEDGLPVISEVRCVACGLCVKACPVQIISILPSKRRYFLACSNPETKAKAMKEMCSRGCTKCRICVKATKSGAVTWGEGLPAIDFEKWVDPELAFEKCPMHTYAKDRAGEPVPAAAPAPAAKAG